MVTTGGVGVRPLAKIANRSLAASESTPTVRKSSVIRVISGSRVRQPGQRSWWVMPSLGVMISLWASRPSA